MSQPEDTPPRDTARRQSPTGAAVGPDVGVDPADLDEPHETPATSDPAEMTEDDAMGGTGGGNAGGAG